MRSLAKAFVGARINDGFDLYHGHAFVIHADTTRSTMPREDVPENCPIHYLPSGTIVSGLVDLQVNGGGGGGSSNPDHRHDRPDESGDCGAEQAIAERVEGVVGIHLEGPHLSVARTGAHDPSLIRAMDDNELAIVLPAAERLPNVMITMAPENTTNAQIRSMSDARVIVSLGHADTDFGARMGAFDAGARCATHLFNTMSQLGNREPGLVGATLSRKDIYAGLIADGIHVRPATIRVALAAAQNNERIMLVTDAMATAGSQIA